MASFQKNAYGTPFGSNVYLRSTRDIGTISRTFSAASLPYVTIDGFPNQKILPKGAVLATITSGPEAGKVGCYQAAGAAEVQVVTPSGTWSGGTFTLTAEGLTTAAIAYNAAAAAIQAALVAAGVTNLVVTGGPLSAGAITLTYQDFEPAGIDQPAVTINVGAITGGGTAAVTTSTPGAAGADDGRGVLTNIVGLNNTFLPWQLVNRDVEVAVVYDADVVQANCLELTAAGLFIPMQNATAIAMVAQKTLDIQFAV